MKKLLLLISLLVYSFLIFGSIPENSDNERRIKTYFELATEPDNSVNGLDSLSREPDKIEIEWEAETANTRGYIILYQQGSSAPNAAVELIDGTAFDANLNPGVLAIEITSELTTSKLIEGLSDITEYTFSVIPYNITGTDITTINYKTSSVSPISIFTIATEPTASVAGLTLESKTRTSAEFKIPQYAFADNGGYILYAEADANPRDISGLVDGVSAFDQVGVFGSFYDIEINEMTVDLSLSSLQPATQYTASVINYNSNGNFQTVNYKITNPPSITFWTLSNPPADKAIGTSFTAPSVGANEVGLDWANVANADGYLVVYSQNQADLDINDIQDGISPAVLATNFPSGVDYGISTNSEINLSALQADRTYYYYVIPYALGADPSTINYITQAGPDLGSFTTSCIDPTTKVTGLQEGSVTSSSVELTWDDPANLNVLVVARLSSISSQAPIGGDSYNADSNFSNADEIENADNFVVYDGDGTGVTITNLDDFESYIFDVYLHNTNGNCYGEAESISQQTECLPATTTVNGEQATNVDTNQLNIEWNRSSSDVEVLVVARLASESAVAPSLNSNYDVNNSFGTGGGSAQTGANNFVVYKGAGNSVNIINLNPNTNYAFDLYEYNPKGFCYNTTPETVLITTECLPPSSQSSFSSIDNDNDVNPQDITLSWDNAISGANRYLVVAREDNSVSFKPDIGTSYNGLVDVSYSDGNDLPNGPGKNVAIYDGTGNTVTVTGLDTERTYHFAIFAYNSDGNCYFDPNSPGRTDATTKGALANNTLSINVAAPAEIDPVAHDNSGGSFITVLDFNIVEGGGDGVDTKLELLTFDRAATDYFATENINWNEIIAEARLLNVSNNETESGTVSANNIIIDIASNENDNSGEIGYVGEGETKNFRLQIRLRESITAADIDNKNLVFELSPTKIETEENSEQFNQSSSAISSGDTNNKIEVEASQFTFIEPSSTIDINATENFMTAPKVEVTDENGNFDLDYVNGYTLSNAGGITVNNPPADFSNGVLTFPVNFNYQGSGDGTLSIVDAGNSIASATSNDITVNPKIELSEITASYNNTILESGEQNEAVLGFELSALSSATIEELVVNVDQSLANRISNVRLFSSNNNAFDPIGDNDLATGIIDNGVGTITFSTLSLALNETPSYYFVVVEVDETVSSSDPDINFSIELTDFSISGDFLIVGSTISETYSFEDIIAPEIVSVSTQPSFLADVNTDPGTEAFQIIIEYNEEMNTDLLNEPDISFPNDDLSESLSFSSLSSGWDVDGLVYTAYFDVSDDNVTIKDIDIRISTAEDVSGNTQLQYDEADLFSIDTENPGVSLSLNRTLVNQPNNTITLTAEFNEIMDGDNIPDFSISENANFDNGVGSWNGTNTIYTITFTHDQTEEFQEDVFISISNALDTAGNNITSKNSGFFDVNTIRSKVEAITSINSPITYKEGDGPIEITIDFDQNVSVGGSGNPILNLNAAASATANYVSNTDDKITFSYTISDGDNADPLEVISIDLNGAIITNDAGNPANLALQGNQLSDDKTIVIDTESPTITSITSTTTNGIYGPGEEINIKVIFSENIQQAGTAPTLNLNTNTPAVAIFENITKGNELNFTYTVGDLGDGENTNDLAVTAISSSENEILDIVGNPSDLSLNVGNNTLANLKNIVIDTEAPTLDPNPFFPANESFNVSLSETFSITLNEAVSGAGNDNIRLHDKSDGTVLATLDGSTAFANSGANTLNFNSLSAILQESTEYYIEFDEGAIVDIAGNPLAAFTGESNWSFTTFGPARIDNFSVAACVGEVFTIEGKYFTGVSQILTDIESGSPFEITTFSVDDNTISFTVPNGTVPGKITLNKINGEDGNSDDASTTSATAIKVGPSSGQIVLVTAGTDVVCDVPGTDPAPVETSIRFDIVGGSGTYEVEYTDGVSNFVESNYNSGDEVLVNPPKAGNNTYSIISIRDEDPDLNSCVAANNGSDLIIREFEQSEVEAGGTLDTDLGIITVSVCLAEIQEVDLSDVGLMGVLPSIEGDITTGEWTIVDGPSSGGGSFSNSSIVRSTTVLRPTYYPSLADASFGSVTLRLTSDDPTAPNPCSRDFDEITIVFANTVSVNIGSDLNTCIETDEMGNQSVIQALNATLGGGASTLEWSRDDQFGEAASHDGSWGFAASADASNFTLTTTIEDPFYKASPEELENGIATVSAIPTGGGCGGGSAQARTLNIFINEVPTPTRSLAPTIVCGGEEGVRFRMSPSSTQNTFEWTLSNEGPDYPGLNDNNQIDGLRTGNILIINFREVSTEEVDTLIVKEISPNGCESVPDSIFVTLKPKPVANITYNGNTTLSQGGARELLTGEGGVVGNEVAGGVFSGPGVVVDQNGKYYLDPSILGVTDLSDPSDDVIIDFIYTDDFGCSATESIRFNIYAEGTSFQNLSSDYCVTDESDTIYVTPSITGDDFEVIGIVGPGITEIGLQNEVVEGNTIQVFKAIFNPAEAFDQNQSATDPSGVNLGFTLRQISNPTNISTQTNIQSVNINPLPTLEFEGPEYDLCTYDEAANLEAIGSNNLTTYSFRLLSDSLPNNLLSGNGTDGYEFDPAPLDSYLDSIGQTSIEIFMEYTYTNASGCSDSDSLSFFVYKQPDQPQLDNVNLCNINGEIETAVINNYDGNNPNLELEWYTNSDLTGDPVATGLSFTPPLEFFANTDEVKFYVSRININSSGEVDELCLSQPTEITYRQLGIPELSWNKSSFGAEGVVFTASQNEQNVENYTWVISKLGSSGLEEVERQTITNLEDLDLAVDFTNYGAGQYQIDFTINTLFNCSTSISEQLVILPEFPSSSAINFNFEESNQGWVTSIDENNSWERATPSDSSSIQTNGSFWITNASGSYNPGEQSYVYSPVFDISQIDKPVVNFDLWIDVIDNVDGLILEYSTDDLILEDPNKRWNMLGNFDDGISSGLNWYESTGIRSRPSTDNISPQGIENNNIFGQGWSAEAEGEAMRLEAKHALSEIPEEERDNIIFRFQFKSNNTGFLPDGVAFDNFTIESLNRNVIIEYFGDEGNTSDAQEMQSLATEAESSTSLSWINYRILENDPLFAQNASAMLSRIYQYEAYEASNQFAIDGDMKQEYSFNSNAGRNDLRNSELVSSSVNMAMNVAKVGEDVLNISLDYSSTITFPENTRLFVAVLYKEINGGAMGTNADKTYYNVLREILPEVEGTDISGSSNASLEFSFTASRESDAQELVLVSFIQDVETGAIYQSANIQEVPLLSYSEVLSNNSLAQMGIQIYPNPAREHLNLTLDQDNSEKLQLKVFDLTGKLIMEERVEPGVFQHEINTQKLKTGMYNLMITNEKGDHKILKFAVSH